MRGTDACPVLYEMAIQLRSGSRSHRYFILYLYNTTNPLRIQIKLISEAVGIPN